MSATLTRVCSALVRFNMSLCALTRHEASRACSSLCLHAGARRVRAEGGRPRDLDAPDSRAKKPGGHDVTPRPVCQQATPSPAVRSALREACSPPHARVPCTWPAPKASFLCTLTCAPASCRCRRMGARYPMQPQSPLSFLVAATRRHTPPRPTMFSGCAKTRRPQPRPPNSSLSHACLNPPFRYTHM
jgi:hypothetical protein